MDQYDVLCILVQRECIIISFILYHICKVNKTKSRRAKVSIGIIVVCNVLLLS